MSAFRATKADQQVGLLTATPAIWGRASAAPAISGHREKADSQDSGGYTGEARSVTSPECPVRSDGADAGQSGRSRAWTLDDQPGLIQQPISASSRVRPSAAADLMSGATALGGIFRVRAICFGVLPMLRAAGPGPSAPLEELARDCERRLTAITGRPARADDDWPVPWSGGCGCELCGTLGGFLAGRGERTLE